MTAPQRMRAWGAGVSAGYLVLAVVCALLQIPNTELLFGLSAALTLALALVTAPLLRPRRRGDDDGGLGASPPPDEPEPPWWPEFERDLRDYTDRLTSVRG